MIQVFAIPNEEQNLHGRAVVLVDGLRLETHASWASDEAAPPYFTIFLTDPRDIEVVLPYSIEDFPPLNFLSLEIKVDWLIYSGRVRIEFQGEPDANLNNDKQFKISFRFTLKLEAWSEEYSFFAYYAKLEELFKNNSDFSLKWSEVMDKKGFQITQVEPIHSQLPIRHLTEKLLSDIKPFQIEAVRQLEQEEGINNFSVLFAFPEEVRPYCEQYLFYFSRFLSDIGIKATSSLKETAGKILFSISPTDDLEALDKIREALAVYLNLPSSPIIYDESFASIRLQQQIENLQHSQKMAAREVQLTEKLLIAQSDLIREKNLIVSQKDSTIEQQNTIIEKITSKSIMMDSLEDKAEFEKTFDGLEVGESKWLKENLGIKLNPAKVIKAAGKKMLGKKENISILPKEDEE